MSETLRLDPTEYQVHDTDPSLDSDETVHTITSLGSNDPNAVQAEFISTDDAEHTVSSEDEDVSTSNTDRRDTTSPYQNMSYEYTYGPRPAAANIGRAALFETLESILGPNTLGTLEEEKKKLKLEADPPSDTEVMDGLAKDLTVDVSEKDMLLGLDRADRYDLADRLHKTLENIPGGQEKLQELEVFIKNKRAVEHNAMAWADEIAWIQQAQGAIIALLDGLPSARNQQQILDTVPKHAAYKSNQRRGKKYGLAA